MNKGIQVKELSSLNPPEASPDHDQDINIKVESLNDGYYNDNVSEPDSEEQYLTDPSSLQIYLNAIVEKEYEIEPFAVMN